MKRQDKKRGLLSTVTAAAATLLLAFGGAQAAHADVIIPDADATGTLNIHKYEQPSAPGAVANGLPQDVSGLTAIELVEFQVQPVTNVDLSTNAGWQAAAKISYNAATNTLTGNGSNGQPATLGAAVDSPQVTDEDGLAKFENLPIGLYLVTETSAPAGVTMAAPFLITVPLTHPTALNEWLYDVHVYPKNTTTNITKTVKDEDSVVVGDEVVWTILADIPKTANPDYEVGGTEPEWVNPSGYKVVDPLASRLEYVSAAVTLTNNGADLVETTDYILTAANTANQNTVEVVFTETGLAKLGAAAGQSQVQIVLTTKVIYLDESDPAEVGTIKNKAVLFPNLPSFDIEPGEPGGPKESNEPETRWGDILIEKVDARDEDNVLEGAVFQVFDSEDNAKLGADPISVAGKTEFTTDEDGKVRISGLRYSTYENGADLDENDYRVYWLVEIKSPDGYELLAQPVPVIVNASGAAVSVTQIENAPHNAGFDLPLTGAAGTWMFTIAGIALIGGGLLVASRKKATR